VAETLIPDDKGGVSDLVVIGEEVFTRGRILLEDEKSPGDFDSDQVSISSTFYARLFSTKSDLRSFS